MKELELIKSKIKKFKRKLEFSSTATGKNKLPLMPLTVEILLTMALNYMKK